MKKVAIKKIMQSHFLYGRNSVFVAAAIPLGIYVSSWKKFDSDTPFYLAVQPALKRTKGKPTVLQGSTKGTPKKRLHLKFNHFVSFRVIPF